MRIIALIVLVFGVALAGGAVFFASERYQAMEELARRATATVVTTEPQIKTVSVVVASRALKYGEELTADKVKLTEFPEAAVPENAFSSMDELFGINGSGERRIVLRSIETSEPIFKAKITGFGERATISAQLTPGMRAFTLRIDSVSGVAGFLLPDDRVDIFLTRAGENGLASNLIMQNVKVIAVDQFSDNNSSRARVARTATVEVSSDDAQKLALAQQVGNISLSLRQIDEVAINESKETISVDVDDLIQREEVAPEAAPEAKARLCVRKGTELICNDG